MKRFLLVISLLYNIVSIGQVNLQSGASIADFPLFEYSSERARLSTSIRLSYESGNGIKVNDLAGNVGTNWALQAGGVISRIQHGEPDDQYFTGSSQFKEIIVATPNVDFYYGDGYMYSTISPQDPMPIQVSHVPAFPGTYRYKHNLDDREQDVYAFRFNGRAGQFVIGKNKQVQVLDDSKLAISFEENDMTAQKIRTKIFSFTITDEAGIRYRFDQLEIEDVMTYKTLSSVNGYQLYDGNELPSTAVRKVITRWFLSEIKNNLTNEKITFTYDDYSVDMQGAKHLSRQTIQDGGNNYTSKQVLVERSKYTSKRLTSIIYPDLYKVQFNYAAQDRVDLPGDKALTQINILYDNNLLYAYQLNYNYFLKSELKPYNFSFQPAEIRFARLSLADFHKTGPDGSSLPSYKFTYFMGEGGFFDFIPPQFSLESDHWGFYYPASPQLFVDAAGNPTADFGVKSITGEHLWSRNGTLKKIEYPEGGSLEFEYEINKAEASPYQGKQVGGVRVSRTILYDGDSHTRDIIKQYKYINEGGTLSSGWGFEFPVYTETKTIRQYKLSNNWLPGQFAQEIASNFVRDLLIARLMGMASQTLGGSFLTGAAALNVVYATIATYILSLIFDQLFDPSYKDYFATIIKSDNVIASNPLPFQYARVEVLDEGNTNGKVVYEFTTDQLYPLRFSTLGPPYSSAKQRFGHWLYGLPKKIIWKNSLNQDVRILENQYVPIVRELNNSNFISRSWSVNTDVSADVLETGIFSNSFINSETFYPMQGRVELTKTIETTFNSNGQSTSNETSFIYSPNNFLLRRISKKDSRGNFTGTTTYYSGDYTVPEIVGSLNLWNIVNAPMSINHWVKGSQPTDNEQLISSVVTQYGQTPNSDMRPSQVFKSELSAPLDNTIADPDNYDPGNLINYPYLKPNAGIQYIGGNPSQTTNLPGNALSSSIYDYQQEYSIAEVSNAPRSQIQYTSFEADGKGGWVYDPNAIATMLCPTGKKCFDLNKGNIQSGILPSFSNVIVSMWTTGSQVVITRTQPFGFVQQFTPTRTGPTINGWKYCEFDIPDNELVNISIVLTGNGMVDELRWYPWNARMSTCTYDPGIGKTSECDVNNRITYYEYDGLGRLIQVRDQFRNLVKAYEYNYKQ